MFDSAPTSTDARSAARAADDRPILIAGGTGFVGRRLADAFAADGQAVRVGSRRRARDLGAHQTWVPLDVASRDSARVALHGCRAAVYLVHGMGDGSGYAEREAKAARAFATAAADAGIERMVYLGGVLPAGELSTHLRARRQTGAILRAGPVPCVELRAGMIIGAGSASFQLVKDLATRLPALPALPWLWSRSQPVAVDDVVDAIRAALTLNAEGDCVLDLPGPETLSGVEIMRRVARALGAPLPTVGLPAISGHGLTAKRAGPLVARLVDVDDKLAAALVAGFSSDLIALDGGIYERVPQLARTAFDEAVWQALSDTASNGRLRKRLTEGAVLVGRRGLARVSRRASRTRHRLATQ
jgi:uncharacterized protein YbjT (DUF2867 family)